jgi:SpoVK/Ycf46/Vps4 family AAA+-type ATPase
MDSNKKFIECIEGYRNTELTKKDYLDILKLTSNDYKNNSIHINHNLFGSCSVAIKNVNVTKEEIEDINDNLNSNDILLQRKGKEIENLLKEYKYIKENLKEEKIVIKKVKNVMIKCRIDSINDLIKLIEDNEYEDDTEYNIDLESLHKIKEDLHNLDNMIGLKQIKDSILDQLLYFLQNLHKVGNESIDYKHIVLYGPPGTGKTELAKIIGKIYSKIGILSKNKFKKATRSDLIGGYLGQTAIKTDKLIKESIGGVLFIDEAYSLAHNEQGDSYSKECLDVINEALSQYKDDLMVIIAGYEKELNETVFASNPGLKSRFIWRFNMEKYDYEQLYEIFLNMINKIKWKVDNSITKEWFLEKKDKFESYGRDIESLLTHVKISHGRRLYGNETECKMINMDDLNNGYKRYLSHKKVEDKRYLQGLYV